MTGCNIKVRLEPWAVETEVPPGASLQPALAAHGVEFPCGGSGTCGGCRVRVLSGSLPITSDDEAAFSDSELSSGWRLACHAQAGVPLVLQCGQARMDVLSDSAPIAPGNRRGFGIAIDLGTTTIAVQLVNLASGDVLAVRTALNQQVRFGSDIMTRVGAALAGADLTSVIREQLGAVISELAEVPSGRIKDVVLVGNTVMHHLFCGLRVGPLAHAPFQSPNLHEQSFSPQELGWRLPAECTIRFAPCIGGFVGSDIRAGILATSIGSGDEVTALVDLGTNGEIAIGNRHGIVCASTAAGPAFEAGTIRMGMRAALGAIAHVASGAAGLRVSTIGDVEPRGICGSGVVDAVAAGLECGAVLPSGRLANGSRAMPIAGPVVLYQSDIRELQLAKAAIASGLTLLLDCLHVLASRLHRIHLAGAFGNYLHVQSAIAIGLFEGPSERIHPAGNTALRGARMMLVAGATPECAPIQHVALAALPGFEHRFESCIRFPAAVAVE